MRISDWSSDVCSSDLADQQVAPVLVGGRQAETPERPAGLDVVAFVQALAQRGRGAAGNVADRDFHGIAGTQRLVVDPSHRVAASGRASVGVLYEHLHELARTKESRVGQVGRRTWKT